MSLAKLATNPCRPEAGPEGITRVPDHEREHCACNTAFSNIEGEYERPALAAENISTRLTIVASWRDGKSLQK
jgi:hypothetical protein